MGRDIYKDLEICKEYTLDEYWTQIFDLCSKGKFPKGMRIINENSLLVTTTKQKKNYQIPCIDDDSHHVLFEFMMGIFKNDLQMKSELDKHRLWNTYRETKVEKDIKMWKDIKTKNLRQTMLENYVLKLKEEYKLNVNETRHLLNLIKFHLNMGRIPSNSIIIKNGQIDTITSIAVDPNNPSFIDIEYKDETKPERTADVKKPWLECEKFIQQRNKNALKI